jgi:hypothetical protein
MTRPAWLVGGHYVCSYCGRRLGIVPMGDAAILGPGWSVRDGRAVWRAPSSRTRRLPDGTPQPLGKSTTAPLPLEVTCGRRGCGETIALPMPPDYDEP